MLLLAHREAPPCLQSYTEDDTKGGDEHEYPTATDSGCRCCRPATFPRPMTGPVRSGRPAGSRSVGVIMVQDVGCSIDVRIILQVGDTDQHVVQFRVGDDIRQFAWPERIREGDGVLV